MDNIEKILEELNSSLAPISEEINTKLKFLQDFVGDKRDLSFKDITMEDIKE